MQVGPEDRAGREGLVRSGVTTCPISSARESNTGVYRAGVGVAVFCAMGVFGKGVLITLVPVGEIEGLGMSVGVRRFGTLGVGVAEVVA